MIDLQTELKGTYEVIPQSESFCIRLKPLESWSYFHGHFPSSPILPAVGIIDISRHFIESYILKRKADLKKISFFKIKTPVLPGQFFLVQIQKEDGHRFQVSWKNESENSGSADFQIEFSI